MIKKIAILIFSLTSLVSASDLVYKSGSIQAHTEVFGDLEINPYFKVVNASLTMLNRVDTLRGKIELDVKDFVSGNTARDTKMREVMTPKDENSKITYYITRVKQERGYYTVTGLLNLYGHSNETVFYGKIDKKRSDVSISLRGELMMTAFGMTPPEKYMLTVRDLVEVEIEMKFNQLPEKEEAEE